MVRDLVFGWLVLSGVVLLFFLSASIVSRHLERRRAERGDKRLLHDIQVMEPLSKEQMDELDKYAHMEELAECPELREEGFRELERYANREAA